MSCVRISHLGAAGSLYCLIVTVLYAKQREPGCFDPAAVANGYNSQETSLRCEKQQQAD